MKKIFFLSWSWRSERSNKMKKKFFFLLIPEDALYFRGLFTTQSNIYDGKFCKSNRYKLLTIFAKNLYHRCLTEF